MKIIKLTNQSKRKIKSIPRQYKKHRKDKKKKNVVKMK